MKKFTDTMFGLEHPKFGNQIWTTAKIRTNKKCRVCRVELKGRTGWRPTTNCNNRGDRVCDVACLKIYERTIKE